jgi:hypothetical protein
MVQFNLPGWMRKARATRVPQAEVWRSIEAKHRMQPLGKLNLAVGFLQKDLAAQAAKFCG